MTQVDFFRVDMAKVNDVPNVDIFLQLLATFNDINGLGNIGLLLARQWSSQKEADEWTNDKLYEMLTWQMYKLRISTTAEGLRNLLLPIKMAQHDGSMEQIWKYIDNIPEVFGYYKTLEDYLPGPNKRDRAAGAGKYYNELTVQLFIRDKMSGHHDKEPLVDALNVFITKHQDAGKDPFGWFQDGDSGHFTRAIFLDNLQMLSWYSKNGIEPNFGSDLNNDPRVTKFTKHIDAMLRSFSNFVSELCIAYMNEYKLLVQADKPEWIPEDH